VTLPPPPVFSQNLHIARLRGGPSLQNIASKGYWFLKGKKVRHAQLAISKPSISIVVD
jgi:hypothetical protein